MYHPPAPPIPPSFSAVNVLCAGCRTVLNAPAGVIEFACPVCQMPQKIPPIPPPLPPPIPPPSALLAPPSKITKAKKKQRLSTSGSDKVTVPCSGCNTVLGVSRGVAKVVCPKCGIEIAVEVEEVNELAVEIERDEDEGGMAGETFTDYRPAKLSMGPPHPDPVVETSSLSAVQPPAPTYDPKIKDYLESSKVLSCLQIETLVYACQRHLLHLPNGARAGFFIGDGAGVGKGRTVAGLIWENWNCGRRKALWISVGSDLKYDARRDLDDMGAKCIKGFELYC